MRRLRDEYLPTLVRQLAEARDDPAALKEAGDLLAVQQEQHRVQQRVAELGWLLTVAREVAPPVDRVIALGSHVEVADDGEVDAYQLVDPCEANLAEGRVSIASPVGQALIGHAGAMKSSPRPELRSIAHRHPPFDPSPARLQVQCAAVGTVRC